MAIGKHRVGFYVEVEVDGVYSDEAALIALQANRWPWAGHHKPLEVDGTLNRKPVKAKVVRAQTLMVKPVEEEG